MGTTKIYSRNLTNFRGVDLTSNASMIAPTRFAYLQNMYKDYNNDMGAMAETVVGFRSRFQVPEMDLGSPINGIHCFNAVDEAGKKEQRVYVHAGTHLYRWVGYPATCNLEQKGLFEATYKSKVTVNDVTERNYEVVLPHHERIIEVRLDSADGTVVPSADITQTSSVILTFSTTLTSTDDNISVFVRYNEYYETSPLEYDGVSAYNYVILKNSKSISFVFHNSLYILDGEHFIQIRGSDYGIDSVSKVSYTPTTMIGGNTVGSTATGTTFEQKNMLTPSFKNTFFSAEDCDYEEDENGTFYLDSADGKYKSCVDGTTYETKYKQLPLVCHLSETNLDGHPIADIDYTTLLEGLKLKNLENPPTKEFLMSLIADKKTKSVSIEFAAHDESHKEAMTTEIILMDASMWNQTTFTEGTECIIYKKSTVTHELSEGVCSPTTHFEMIYASTDITEAEAPYSEFIRTKAGWLKKYIHLRDSNLSVPMVLTSYDTDFIAAFEALLTSDIEVKIQGKTQETHHSFEIPAMCVDNTNYQNELYNISGYPYIADYEKGTITFDVGKIPPLTDEPTIEVTATKTYGTIQGMTEADGTFNIIAGCTIGTTFDDRIFLTGNPKCPNHIFWCGINSTGYVDATYWGILNYQQDGVGDAGIVGLLSVGDTLMALKGDTNQDSSIYFHSKSINSGNNEIPVSYPSTQGMAGVGCLGGCANFRDDPIFISRQGVEAIGKLSVKLERAIEHRSAMVDSFLTNRDLSKAMITTWNGYLIIAIDDEFFVADSRQMFTHTDGNPQYEWYYWKDVFAYYNQTIEDGKVTSGNKLNNTCLTTMLDNNIENIFIGTDYGTIYSFNFDKRDGKGEIPIKYYTFDGRSYMSGCATLMDDCGMPLESKTTIKKSLVVRTRTFTRSKLHIKVRTNRTSFKNIADINSSRFDFNDIDFEDLSFETNENSIIAVKDNSKKWAEKQYFIYSDELKAPFALYGIGYKYRISGRIK